MKYPIGIQSFEQIIEDCYVYVDKTDLVYKLTHEGKIYFLSRPRRFGKSLLVSTLKNYYLGHKELFKGLKIDSLEKDWNVHPVFHVDFNGSNFLDEGVLEKRLYAYVRDWERLYGLVSDADSLDLGGRFMEVLRVAHEQTGRRAVVLIDEYDKPILDVLDTDSGLEDRHRYSSYFLRGLPNFLRLVCSAVSTSLTTSAWTDDTRPFAALRRMSSGLISPSLSGIWRPFTIARRKR